MRIDGKNEADAYLSLDTMRHETYVGVGKWRVELAEEHIVPNTIEKISKIMSTRASK
jgi:hypothetical protein